MTSSVSLLRLPFTDWLVAEETAAAALRHFSSSLMTRGLPVKREGDELVHRHEDLEARFALEPGRNRSVIKLTVAIPENLLAAGASNLMDEMALEGLPVVAMGFGRGSATWEFRWNKFADSTWREQAVRALFVIDRLRTALV